LKKYKVIIADDEAPARDELKHILSKIEAVDLVGLAKNGIEVINLIEKNDPDIVFLDIEMPGMNGIDVAKKLLKSRKAPHIIFATAYDNYAVKAFEVNAIDYILKPFDEKRIQRAFQKAKETIQTSNDTVGKIERLISTMKDKSKYLSKLPVKLKGKINFVDINDVVYARSEGGLIFISENGKEFLSEYSSLEKLESDLNPENFHRTHRSYIANLSKMKELVPLGGGHFQIKLRTENEKYALIPLSRRHAKGLKTKYKF